MQTLTTQLTKAFLHVKQFHPEVAVVIFNSNGNWNYMDANFNGLKFDDRINVSILEEAADSIQSLPAIIEFPQQQYFTVTIKNTYCTKVQIEADNVEEAERIASNLPIKTQEDLDYTYGNIIATSFESDTVPINILETYNDDIAFSKNKFYSLLNSQR